MNYNNTPINWSKVNDIILSAKKIVLTTHENPDHLYSLINHRRTTVNLSKEKRGKREKGKRRKREKEKRRKREKEKKGKKGKKEQKGKSE